MQKQHIKEGEYVVHLVQQNALQEINSKLPRELTPYEKAMLQKQASSEFVFFLD